MLPSFSFELLKLRKRTSTWVLVLVFIIVVVGFSYVANYASISAARHLCKHHCGGAFQDLYPKNLLGVVLLTFGNFGTALALILGSLAAGNEYGENTLKTVLTQRPGRLEYISGKLLAMGAVLAIFTVAVFLAGAASSYVVAILQPTAKSLQGPPVVEILKGLGAGWLILACFGSLGFFLAILFQGAAAAIGIGLAYLFAVESLLISVSRNKFLGAVDTILPGRNATGLASAVGGTRTDLGRGMGKLAEPSHAGLVLAAYGIAAISLAMLLFRKRDVT